MLLFRLHTCSGLTFYQCRLMAPLPATILLHCRSLDNLPLLCFQLWSCYSTDQMQGIRRTCFDRILIAFSVGDKHIYRCRRIRLSLAANAFIARDERFQPWKRTRLAMETSVFSDGDERVQSWRRTRLALGTNAFIASDERVQCCRRTRLSLETNAFSAGNERVYNAFALYLASDRYCTLPLSFYFIHCHITLSLSSCQTALPLSC